MYICESISLDSAWNEIFRDQSCCEIQNTNFPFSNIFILFVFEQVPLRENVKNS
jgi:hypothetical protein